MREATARGKYAPLRRHLPALGAEREWRTSFGAVETILGFRLPNSARLIPSLVGQSEQQRRSQPGNRGHHVSWSPCSLTANGAC